MENSDQQTVQSNSCFGENVMMNEVFKNHHFSINRKLQMLICISWPYQNKSLKLFGQIIIVLSIYTLVIPMLIRLFEEWYKEDRAVDVIMECFTDFIYTQAILGKMYLSIHAEKRLQRLYEYVTKDYNDIQDPEERAIMVKMWNFGRLLTILFTAYVCLACPCFVFTPQILPAILDVFLPLNESRPKVLCLYIEYFIDQREYLYHLSLHIYVVGTITGLVGSAVDGSFIVVACHVLGLFNLLINRMKRVSELTNEDIPHRDETLQNFVKDSIKIHMKILELAEFVRSTYNNNFFFTVAIQLVGLSFGTIAFMMNITHPEIALRLLVFWFGIVAYLFYINLPGQKFLDSTDELLDSIYACDWYKLPVKSQLLLKIMMMRCLIPCRMTAGPLLQMSFASCGTVLRLSYSYFTAASSLA